MTVYYLDVCSGAEVAWDEEGQELPDLVAVRAEAKEAAREMIGHVVARGDTIGDREIRVRDEAGAVILVTRLRDVLFG